MFFSSWWGCVGTFPWLMVGSLRWTSLNLWWAHVELHMASPWHALTPTWLDRKNACRWIGGLKTEVVWFEIRLQANWNLIMVKVVVLVGDLSWSSLNLNNAATWQAFSERFLGDNTSRMAGNLFQFASLIGVELSVERVALQIDVYIMYIQGLGPYTIACIFWALEFFLMIMTTRCILSFFSASFGKPEPWYLVKARSVINQVAFGSYLVTWFSGNLLWTNTPLNTPTIAPLMDECVFLKLTTQFSLIFFVSFPQSIVLQKQQQISDAGDASTALWLQYGLDLPERKAVFLAADLETWRKSALKNAVFGKPRKKSDEGDPGVFFKDKT